MTVIADPLLTDHDQILVGNRWIGATSDERVSVVSPHTEQAIASARGASAANVDEAVALARAAVDGGDWSRTTLDERRALVSLLIEAYAPHRERFARLASAQMGAPIAFATAVSGAPIEVMRAMTELALEFPWESRRRGLQADALVRHEPVGVVAAVVPWNVPQFLIMTKLIPALLAGCSIVVKPAPQTPIDALLLAELVATVPFPVGTVSVLPASASVAEHLVGHPGVDKVAFTGSTATGRRIAEICAGSFKRVSLELGGKSPAIVVDDADVEATAAALRHAALANNGQVCIAQTRVIATPGAYEPMVAALAEQMEGLAVGDPSDPSTEVGPLVSAAQRERVRSYIRDGVAAGARLVLGGEDAPAGTDRGWYVRPTLFADVDNGMRVAREEIFGPVVTVIPAASTEHAVALANESDYGLAGSVWTSNEELGLDLARQLRAGLIGVNRHLLDPMIPFGGYKQSGVGRELGLEGLAHYTELKSIFPKDP